MPDRELRWAVQCETIGPAELAILHAHAEMTAPLGPLRLRSNAKVTAVGQVAFIVASTAPADHPGGIAAATPAAAEVAPLASAFLNGPVTSAESVRHIDEFIQELTVPAGRVTVAAIAGATLAIALARGKAVVTGLSGAGVGQITLAAANIDTVIVYTVGLKTMTICAAVHGDGNAQQWANATVVAKGLTLPLREADAALATPAQEFATAKARLVGAETLNPAMFGRTAETLRQPAAADALGRNGARLSLNRIDVTQSFEELSLDQQLSAMALHPKVRRVLGFSHHDRAGLVPGNTYLYRVVGRFDAADLADAIYDVHRIPANTVLPDNFWIRDIGFRCQTPVKVVLDPAPAGGALHASSRRGIRIDTSGYDISWLLPSYDGWSVLISLPQAVTKLVLDVAPGHSFKYAAGLPWAFGLPAPVPLPAGPMVELTFPSVVLELRLSGAGTLYGLRLPSGAKGIVTLNADTPPVTFAAVPLPEPPLVLALTNLQQPSTTLNGPIDESTPVPPRHPVGFRLTWLPALVGGISVWPDDVDSGPPLDALAYAIEHRPVTLPSSFGPWEPINADDNLTLGSRDQVASAVRLEPGCDLDQLFPANRPRDAAGLTLSFSDVFGQQDPTTGVVRPSQPLGSYHQYRIRAVDAAGRISGSERLSNIARLEKHTPPPLPVGPQPAPGLDAAGHLTGPTGARARAIVRGAAGLTPADLAILGAHDNAIVLEWGWRQAERDLDATMAEFRVYSTRPADTVTAMITAVTASAPFWKLSLTTSLPLVADELAGQWINSGGYPFLIAHNDAGVATSITVEASKLQPLLQPVPGPVVFGRPLRGAHQRPAGWDHRVAVYSLTAADSYRHVFFDLLTLDPQHRLDGIWVGVSSADAQSYVPDERASGPLSNRPGNESGIVTCAVNARYRGQPVFSVPPPLGDVPELVTEEPTGRQLLVVLDLAALVGGALPAGSPVALERCSADEVLSRTAVSDGDVILTPPGGAAQTVAFPNPTDHATVLATLNGPTPQRLANRYLMHLLAAAPDPSVFFERPNADIVALGPTTDRLPPKPGRFFYFLRAADALAHLSAGGALRPVVVRVPSVAVAASPQRRMLTATAADITLTVAVSDDPDTTTVLLFATIAPPKTMPPSHPDAELLRVPNRRDLYPHDGVRLRLSDGTLLAPAAIKALDDASVTVEADDTRVAALSLPAAAGSWVTLWCYALTRDGQPSRLCGPFGQGLLP